MTAAHDVDSPGCLLDDAGLARTVRRLAHEVVERHPNLGGVVVAAVRDGGVRLAVRLVAELEALGGHTPRLCALDVGDYRDDRPRPASARADALTALDGGATIEVDGVTVLLVDDVIHTGRTLRAALDLLAAHGRPAAVEPLVLVDRGRRELPLRATYVGKNVPAGPASWVEVVMEPDGAAGAFLVDRR